MAQDENERRFRQRQREANLAAGFDSDETRDETLAKAQGALDRQGQILDRVSGYPAERAALDKELARLQEESRVGPVLGRAGKAALIPASFLGGPVGIGATAALGGLSFAEGDALGAGLAAIPFAGHVKRGMSALRGINGATRTGRNFGSSFKRATDDDMASFARGKKPAEWPEREMREVLDPSVAQRNEQKYIDQFLGRSGSPSTTTAGSSSYRPSMNLDDIARDESVAARFADELPMPRAMPRVKPQPQGQSLDVLDDLNVSQELPSADEAVGLIGALEKQLIKVPPSKRLPRIEQLEDVADPQVSGSMGDIDEVLAGLKQALGGVPGRAARPDRATPADFLRRMREGAPAPFRTGEQGRFGMGRQRLPELSENELARVSGNIDRVYAKRKP